MLALSLIVTQFERFNPIYDSFFSARLSMEIIYASRIWFVLLEMRFPLSSKHEESVRVRLLSSQSVSIKFLAQLRNATQRRGER
jgi:hypothetical protein